MCVEFPQKIILYDMMLLSLWQSMLTLS